MANRVLTFDLAKTAGWAFGPRPAGPLSGEQVLYHGTVGDNAGRLYANARQFFNDMISAMQPTKIVYEAPLPIRGKDEFARAEHTEVLLFGLEATLLCVCCERWLPYQPVNLHKARKAVLGRANFGGGDGPKQAVMEYCGRRGWSPKGDNAGDALVLLVFAGADR